MPVVLDLIIRRFKGDHTNLEKKETSSHADAFIELVIKSLKYSDVLPITWIILCGRQQRQESRWIDDSISIFKNLMASIESGTLKIMTGESYNYLVATLCALHKDSIPPVKELLTRLQSTLEEEVQTRSHFQSWMCTVSCYWVLIIKLEMDIDKASLMESLSAG